MAVKKLSVSLSPEASAFVSQRVGIPPNVSGAISEAIERYAALLTRARGDLRLALTENELALILDACNGSLFSASWMGMLWAEIADACELDHLDQKWQVDGRELINKIKAAGLVGQACLVDAAARWWDRVAAGEEPPYSDMLL